MSQESQTQPPLTQNFDKLRLKLHGWLEGRSYFVALHALDFGRRFHTGTRKDGVTPEFAHPIWIANFLRTLETCMQAPETVIAAALLHDLPEDYDDKVSFEDIDAMFGAAVAGPVRTLTKKYRGVRVPDEVYYARIGECPVASLVKPVDRMHNLSSMIGVFNRDKQVEYVGEVRRLLLPAVKTARTLYRKQDPAYENLKQGLATRVQMIEAIHAAGGC